MTQWQTWPTNNKGDGNDCGQSYSLIRVLEHGNVHFSRITWSWAWSTEKAGKERSHEQNIQRHKADRQIKWREDKKQTWSVSLTHGLPRNSRAEGLCCWQRRKPDVERSVGLCKLVKDCGGEGTWGGIGRNGNKRSWLNVKWSFSETSTRLLKPILSMSLCNISVLCLWAIQGLSGVRDQHHQLKQQYGS